MINPKNRVKYILLVLAVSVCILGGYLYPFDTRGITVQLQRVTGPDLLLIEAHSAFYEKLNLKSETVVHLYGIPSIEENYPLPQGGNLFVAYGVIDPHTRDTDEHIYEFYIKDVQEKYIIDLLNILLICLTVILLAVIVSLLFYN